LHKASYTLVKQGAFALIKLYPDMSIVDVHFLVPSVTFSKPLYILFSSNVSENSEKKFFSKTPFLGNPVNK